MLLLCLQYNLAAETFDLWKFRGEVKAPAAAFVALPLGPEILDACDKADLTDLRLADPRGTEIPHAIVREREVREEVELEGQVLNRENPTLASTRLTVDLGSSVLKNRLTVATSGGNFRRRVRVEGSADQASWAEVLREGWLFAVDPDRRFESLDLGPNTYRYLRITVEKMPEEEKAPTIDSVTCRHVVLKQPTRIALSPSLEEYTTDPQQRASIAILDFQRRHLPIARLRLILASDPQRVFRRTCRVSGRNTIVHTEKVRFETEEYGSERQVETPWTHVGSGSVYRDAGGKESLELALEAPFRYLRIVIENGDSPPLDLGGIEGVMHPVYAVFEPAGQTSFRVYCGMAEAPVPRYEAAATLAALEAPQLPKCEASALSAQPGAGERAAPPGQTAVWILLTAAVAATLALLWYTAAARRQKAPAGAPSAPGPEKPAGD